jgi:hypothetical protein
MTQPVTAAAEALRQVGAALGETAARLAAMNPGQGAFGADSPGGPGELGRALHAQLVRALESRGREAAAHGARLTDAGDAALAAMARYDEVDRAVDSGAAVDSAVDSGATGGPGAAGAG